MEKLWQEWYASRFKPRERELSRKYGDAPDSGKRIGQDLVKQYGERKVQMYVGGAHETATGKQLLESYERMHKKMRYEY